MEPRENDGTEREAQRVGRDMSCPRKLFLTQRKSRFLRRSHVAFPRSQVLSNTLSAITLNYCFFQTSDRGWPAYGRLVRRTSAKTKISARLKITFVPMTYPKGWTGHRPLCPLIFS